MDGLGAAASVVAVVELSAKIASLCVEYSRAVKHAKDDIERLRREVGSLAEFLRELQQFLDGPHNAQLSTSPILCDALKSCRSQLTELEKKLNPGKRQKAMSRVGLRVLKWPFESKDVNKIVDELNRHKQTVSVALQLDQT